MSDVSLSASIRQNLLTLQKTASQMEKTQINLATGHKVNRAIDSPSAFFTSESLKHRSDDLANLLDSIGQVIQTIKTADEGITAIADLIESARSAANSAKQADGVEERAIYVQQYNDLMEQIESIAEDSGYNGKNLLGGSANNFTVYFNEDNTNALVLTAVDYTDTTDANFLNLPDLDATYTEGTASIALGASVSGNTVLNGNVAGFSAGDTVTVTNSIPETRTLSITATTTVDELVQFYDDTYNLKASFDDTTDTINLTSLDDFTLASDGAGGGTYAGNSLDFIPHSWVQDSAIQASLDRLTETHVTIRAQVATFGSALTIVENRQNFTSNMIDALAVGADKLTLADLNEEGANMLALQTRQQLASTSLSISSDSASSVLALFR